MQSIIMPVPNTTEESRKQITDCLAELEAKCEWELVSTNNKINCKITIAEGESAIQWSMIGYLIGVTTTLEQMSRVPETN